MNVNAIPRCSVTLLAKLRDVGIADIEIIAVMSPLDIQRICGIPDGDGLVDELVDLVGMSKVLSGISLRADLPTNSTSSRRLEQLEPALPSSAFEQPTKGKSCLPTAAKIPRRGRPKSGEDDANKTKSTKAA